MRADIRNSPPRRAGYTRNGARVIAFFLLLLAACLPALSASAHAAVVRSTAAEAELVAAQSAIVPGQSLQLGLRLKLDPGWHVYWKNAGDSGNPPTLQVKLPPGFKAGSAAVRVPAAHSDRTSGQLWLRRRGAVSTRVQVPLHIARRVRLRLQRARIGSSARSRVCPRARISRSRCRCPRAPSRVAGRRSSKARAQTSAAAARRRQARRHARCRRRVHLRVEGLSDCGRPIFFPNAKACSFMQDRADSRARPICVSRCRSRPMQQRREQLVGRADLLARDGASGAFQSRRRIAVATGPIAHERRRRRRLPCFRSGRRCCSHFARRARAQSDALCVSRAGTEGAGTQRTRPRACRSSVRSCNAVRVWLASSLSCLLLALVMLALRAAGEQVGWGFQLQSSRFVSALALLFFVLG